jgi:hypothetical protein
VVRCPDERARSFFEFDRARVALDGVRCVLAELGQPAERAGDAAHAEEAAGGDDHPFGERFEQRLELGS